MLSDPLHHSVPPVINGQAVEFETVPCNYCHGSREVQLFEGRDRYLGLPGCFRLVRCLDCGLIRQNPRPTPETMSAYYPPNYEPFSLAIADESNPLRRWDRRLGMIKRRRLVERHATGGRLLDVGCATGNFLAEMATGGKWEVVGVEPSARAAAYAAERFGLDVRAGTLATLDLPAEAFDVVTLWNVLEHLHDPIDDLRRIRRLLRPGGSIIFSLPNLESFEVKLFGERWFCWELPRHLYFFPRTVLVNILADLGFRLEESVCLSGSQLTFAQSLQYLYSGGERRFYWNRAAASAMLSLPGRVLLIPVFYTLARLRQATIITHVGQRR